VTTPTRPRRIRFPARRVGGEAPQLRGAVIDLGSTTFQLLVADVDADGGLTPVIRDRVVLNLGMVLASHGHIPTRVARAAADTARRLHDVAVRAGSRTVVPIATSALRDSPNRDEIAALLENALGQPARFIDGSEEARLTLLGVTASVAVDGGPSLLLDLGGGSLEVALADEGGLRWGRSLRIGAGRLTGLLVASNPPTSKERKKVIAAVRESVGPLAPDVAAGEPARCIASGGTAGALARLIATARWASPPESLNQFTMTVSEVGSLTRNLASMPLKKRLLVPGIDERRADLLPVGGWVLTTAAKAFGVREFIHSEWGFREGALLDELGFGSRRPPTYLDLRRRAVDRVVRSWGEDPRHLALVARVSDVIFEGTRTLHGLGEREREWLSHASRLHAVGSRISPARMHKHGAYLVEHAGLRGFSPHEIAVLASIVRFHRGKEPRTVYPAFATLPAATRRAVVVLVGILRMAHAIARGPEDENLVVTVKAGGGRVRVKVAGSSNPDAAVGEAAESAPLLGKAIHAEVEVVEARGS
jgi:exopolyphosphatase/guanosine-5'-triphosphate,3'-diphosphate pyrophosphatase